MHTKKKDRIDTPTRKSGSLTPFVWVFFLKLPIHVAKRLEKTDWDWVTGYLFLPLSVTSELCFAESTHEPPLA